MAAASSQLVTAHQPRRAVIAGGMEELDQARWLREHTVPRAQGFLWARPQSPADIESLLQP